MEESELIGFPKPISYGCTKKIIEQMEKNICKIEIGDTRGTGFFIKILYKYKILKLFITNNHIINEDMLNKKIENIKIKIKSENNYKILNLKNRKTYTNKEHDVTIIEINKDDKIKNFLELDDNIINGLVYNNDTNIEYKDKTIYIPQYPEGELSVSYGIINNIYVDKKYNFNHKGCTRNGSSGAPIIYINNKVIGIHKKGDRINNIGTFLYYPIKEFLKQYNDSNKLLEEFNNKYNLNIKNINVEKIELTFKNIDNEQLKNLCMIEFKELKELNLYYNEISDIKVLEVVEYENLLKLDLSQNKISDINVLENIKFKGLKELYLSGNKISDINVLENAKFEKLEKLYLGNNKIMDISILEKVKFEKLKKLYLGANKISDIKVLENVNFKELKELYLGDNNISDIKVLQKANFKELKELYLCNNNISDIKVFEIAKFEQLELLYLNNNKIDKIKNASIIFKLKSKIKNFNIEQNY